MGPRAEAHVDREDGEASDVLQGTPRIKESGGAQRVLPAAGPSTATAQFATFAISPVSPGNQRSRSRRATFTRPMSTGTSTSGPMTAANAAPCAIPNVATATAMASSKLFEAAVK